MHNRRYNVSFIQKRQNFTETGEHCMDVTMLNEISDEVKKYNARLLPVIKGRETEEIL